ncbi:MAG: hypothetical protein Q9168_008365 [Polycauliona sp. 1 TL-2023]
MSGILEVRAYPPLPYCTFADFLSELLDPKHHETAFAMSNAPDSAQTHILFGDLFEQAKELSYKGQDPCSFSFDAKSVLQGGVVSVEDARNDCDFGAGPVHVLDLAHFLKVIITAKPGRNAILRFSLSQFANDKDLPQAKKDLSEVLSSALHPASGDIHQETTVIIMPPSNAKAKRASTSQYGSYAMPHRQPLQARKGQTEAPLAAPPAPQTSSDPKHVSTPETLKASPVRRLGILPVCQPNLDTLIEVTNNCSGHGTPYLKGKDLQSKHSKNEDLLKSRADETQCYACKCSKTVLSTGEGKGVKTIYWAGPACAKKDVSAPFWLLAGISIAMVATVAWGVGLLFSIGQEDLPSVIGAGVTGPKAQK